MIYLCFSFIRTNDKKSIPITIPILHAPLKNPNFASPKPPVIANQGTINTRTMPNNKLNRNDIKINSKRPCDLAMYLNPSFISL